MTPTEAEEIAGRLCPCETPKRPCDSTDPNRCVPCIVRKDVAAALRAAYSAGFAEARERAQAECRELRQHLEGSRDRARQAGRELVFECRQSDIETTERVELSIRTLQEPK